MNCITKIISFIAYKLAPIRNNRLVFSSFDGHYSDSPKYIANKIYELLPQTEIFFLIEEKYKKEIPHWIKTVEIDSIKAYWIKGSAKAVVDNVYCGRAYVCDADGSCINTLRQKMMCNLRSKKNQNAYTTWHGTPLKKIGRDQIGNNISNFYVKNVKMFLNNDYSKRIMENVTFNKIPILNFGLPRNDILFACPNNIKDKLNLPNDKKIILFAPTFRNDGKNCEQKNLIRSGIEQLESIDIEKLKEALSKKFGGDWVLVCRFHYHIEKMIDWNALKRKYKGFVVNGNEFDDIAEYLACTDVLLTDYSSSMFDFALTGKPCFLYCMDLEHYSRQERGFYIPIENLPFQAAQNFDDLILNINEFDRIRYKEKIENMLKVMNSIDDGKASDRIANYILKEIENN